MSHDTFSPDRYSAVVRNAGSGSTPNPDSSTNQLSNLGHVIVSLYVSFLICKMGILLGPQLSLSCKLLPNKQLLDERKN